LGAGCAEEAGKSQSHWIEQFCGLVQTAINSRHSFIIIQQSKLEPK